MTPASAATRRWKETPSGQASVARYEQSDRGRETRRSNKALYKARHLGWTREHNRILQRVRWHVARGHIAKTPCAACGSEIVQAHHHMGYAPEHELDVVWLCPLHHTEAHGRSRKPVAA